MSKKPQNPQTTTIETIVVIAKFTNGKYHQVSLNKNQELNILHAIPLICGGSITLIEEEITGIKF